jgi:hypothetical protein
MTGRSSSYSRNKIFKKGCVIMQKLIIFLMVLALLTLPAIAFSDDFGYDNGDNGETWFVTGTVEMGVYHHDGRNEMIEYYYAQLSAEAYGFLRRLASGDGAPGSDYGDDNEVMIYTFDESINLRDYIGERITFSGEAFEGMTIYHRRSIVVEVTAILSEHDQINTQAKDGFIDYLELIGLSPAYIMSIYGEPGEYEEDIAEGERYLEYRYRNATISFAMNNIGDWSVDGVLAHRPASPIRIGGAYVSMEAKYARLVLEKNGYCLEMTDSEGCSFFTNDIATGGFCLVMVWEEGGLVSEISGWQGKTAERLFAAI